MSTTSYSSGKPITLNSEVYIEDPFVTSGLIAIEVLTGKPYEKCSREDLESLVEQIVPHYLTKSFQRELYSLFPNGTYVNPSIKDKKGKSTEFLINLISSRDNDVPKSETCQLCGRPAKSKPYAKDIIPLVGSGKSVNFFPSLQAGIYVCPRCILAIHIAPITLCKIGGKPALVSSSDYDLLQYYVKEAISELHKKIAANSLINGETSAILDYGYRSPANAIFNLAYKFGTEYVDKDQCNKRSRNETIVVYRIDNYLQGGKGVTIYKLPSGTFSFIAKLMHGHSKKNWFSFIGRHYEGKHKKDEDIKKIGWNRIHNKLLNGESILREFRNDWMKQIKNANSEKNKDITIEPVSYRVIETYMHEVRAMHKERLEKIKTFADSISDIIEPSPKKRINGLISAKTVEEFRNQLRLIMADAQKSESKKPLIGFDDFTMILIPGDYRGWTEIRDLIIIRIYENLHDVLAVENEDEDIS